MYIISACLLGENVKYNGGNNDTPWVKTFCQRHRVFPCCPEMLGGLPCPRKPAERRGEEILNTQGEDVTRAFYRGARLAWDQALKQAQQYGEPIEGAILKSKSPSCGKDQIYDGTFQGKLVEGQGVFAQLLMNHGISVTTEKEKIND